MLMICELNANNKLIHHLDVLFWLWINLNNFIRFFRDKNIFIKATNINHPVLHLHWMNGMNWNGKWIKAKPIFKLFLILLFLYSCWETINTTGSFSKQKKKDWNKCSKICIKTYSNWFNLFSKTLKILTKTAWDSLILSFIHNYRLVYSNACLPKTKALLKSRWLTSSSG